jgi:hypothetical protein
LEKDFKIISFRQAVKIEHPGGIPLAKNLQDYGLAWDGNLLISYEPPIVIKNTISVGVVVRINRTTISFSGTLETEFAGDTFSPSQDLVSAVQKAVKQMAEDIDEKNNATIGNVIEELLNYCVVNVPVKQIYEKIRVEYPREYRFLNLEYKRRTGSTIEDSMPDLVSQQQRFRFGSNKSLVKVALKKKDVVTINTYALNELKKDPQQKDLYDRIIRELSVFDDINSKFVIEDDPRNGYVNIVGLNRNSKTGMTKTDNPIPEKIFKKEEEYDDTFDEDEANDIAGNSQSNDSDSRFKKMIDKFKQMIPGMDPNHIKHATDIVLEKLSTGKDINSLEIPFAFKYIFNKISDIMIVKMISKSPSKNDIIEFYNKEINKKSNKYNSMISGFIMSKISDGMPLMPEEAEYVVATSYDSDNIITKPEQAQKYFNVLWPAYISAKKQGKYISKNLAALLSNIQDQFNKTKRKDKKRETERVRRNLYSDMAEQQIPRTVFKDINLAKQYKEKLFAIRDLYNKIRQPLPPMFTNLINQL